MSVRQRVVRLEEQMTVTRTLDSSRLESEEDWLALFEALAEEDAFATEPDFPVALATFRQAMEQAAARTDPPFDPPEDFLSTFEYPLRLMRWRDKDRFPAVHAAFMWLLEMSRRVGEGIPPVTEAGFSELAEWFDANEKRLYQLSLSSQGLDLGSGRQICTANIRSGLTNGARAVGAGELAENLRQLRACYG